MALRIALLATLLLSLGCDDDPPVGGDDAGADATLMDAGMPDTTADDAGGDAATDAAADADPCAMMCDGECVEAYSSLHCGGCNIRCDAFERCNTTRDRCDCDPLEPLCGTYGYARWPVGAPQFQNRGDFIEDNRTDLLWQRVVDDTRRTFFDARSYCDALTIGGRDDWRLPGRMELVTILDGTRTPSLDYNVFPDTPENYFWTQSRSQFREDRAYSIYFGQGETVLSDVGMASAYVRCVATDVVDFPTPMQAVDEFVEDANTELRWDREYYAAVTWQEAYDYCAERGSRIPTLNELQSLVDEAGYNPAIDRFLFPDTPYDTAFWTYTQRDLGETVAWTLNFGRGQTDLDELTVERNVRCVQNL